MVDGAFTPHPCGTSFDDAVHLSVFKQNTNSNPAVVDSVYASSVMPDATLRTVYQA